MGKVKTELQMLDNIKIWAGRDLYECIVKTQHIKCWRLIRLITASLQCDSSGDNNDDSDDNDDDDDKTKVMVCLIFITTQSDLTF